MDDGSYDWQFAIYAARKLLGWSLSEFWQSSPAFFHGQLKEHLKYQRRSTKKKKGQQKKAPLEVRFYDQLPKGAW